MTSLQILDPHENTLHSRDWNRSITSQGSRFRELQKSIVSLIVIMSGDETVHKRDGGYEFEEDGDDEQE